MTKEEIKKTPIINLNHAVWWEPFGKDGTTRVKVGRKTFIVQNEVDFYGEKRVSFYRLVSLAKNAKDECCTELLFKEKLIKSTTCLLDKEGFINFVKAGSLLKENGDIRWVLLSYFKPSYY